MANPEHLKIFRNGVDVWNQWRLNHPEIKPSLSEADLSKANFGDADLSDTDLSGANLIRTNFIRTNLIRANLKGADLGGATLKGADLRNTDLRDADFSWADLRWADLSDADLSRADLKDTDLSGVDLSKANLSEANLSDTDLNGANLTHALLRAARLFDANLNGANLTGACLWETQFAGWAIKDVICEYVYWDEKAEEKSLYDPGDFERMFADKPKIRLFYQGGIHSLEVATIPALIQQLEIAHPGCGWRLVSIGDDPTGAVVELALEETDYTLQEMKELRMAIEAAAQEQVDLQRIALAENQTRLQLEDGLKQFNTIVGKLLFRPHINHQEEEPRPE